MLFTLAESSTTRILIAVIAMIVVVIGGGIIGVMLRRRYHDAGTEGLPLESLSLHTLRQMHAQGGLSDEEFEALKQAAVRSHGAPPRSAPQNSGVWAKPGFDLAGDPLPGTAPQDDENQSGPGSTPHPGA